MIKPIFLSFLASIFSCKTIYRLDLLYETFGKIQKRNPEPLFFEIYEMSLETIMQFDHLASVHDFIDNVIPEMLTENFIPRTELRETTMTILNKRNR